MKITIYHTESSVDPGATVSLEDFPGVLDSLEAGYEKAIKAQYPEAEIEFRREDNTYSHRVAETGMDDPREIEEDVQRILEGVYETGLFWI